MSNVNQLHQVLSVLVGRANHSTLGGVNLSGVVCKLVGQQEPLTLFGVQMVEGAKCVALFCNGPFQDGKMPGNQGGHHLQEVRMARFAVLVSQRPDGRLEFEVLIPDQVVDGRPVTLRQNGLIEVLVK